MILDDYHVSFDAGRMGAARMAVKRMIERMGPSDLAAVMATSGRNSSQAEFTADKARLLQALDGFFPQSEVAALGVAEVSRPLQGRETFGYVQEIKARWATDAMAGAAKALAEIPHRRKAVLLVSQGIPVSLEEIIANPNALGAFQGLRDFIVTAQRSNVAIYPVDPCGLSRDAGCSIDTQENLRSIAEGTGGFAVLNTNAPERGVERMMAETGTYYLLAYYSPAPPNDGKRHRIKVKVDRAAVRVRAREGYVAPRKAAPAATALPLDALIAAPIQTRGLPMHVAAVPVPIAGRPGSTIALSIELDADDAARAGDVAFAAVAVDVNGSVRARQNFATGFARTARRRGARGAYCRSPRRAGRTISSADRSRRQGHAGQRVHRGGGATVRQGNLARWSHTHDVGPCARSQCRTARRSAPVDTDRDAAHSSVRITQRTGAGEDHAQGGRRDHYSHDPRRLGWPDHRRRSDDFAGIRVSR